MRVRPPGNRTAPVRLIISNLTAMPIPKVYGVAFFTPTFQFNRSEFSVRSVGATRSVWARETAGASPAALTIFKLLPWSNTSGIRLLIGTMQVGILPAAPNIYCQVV